jgi:hypothetical protein
MKKGHLKYAEIIQQRQRKIILGFVRPDDRMHTSNKRTAGMPVRAALCEL